MFPLAMLAILSCMACEQNAIFHAIFQEVKPRDPRVEGTPTDMVLFNREYQGEKVPVVYVASGKLHWYAQPDDEGEQDNPNKWWNREKGKVKQPGGKIIGLAVAGDYLYAMTQTSLKRIARNSSPETSWDDVSIPENITLNTIFTSNDRVFIGASDHEKVKPIPFSVFFISDNGTVELLAKTGNKLLEGVAYNGTSYFLCTNDINRIGGAIYKFDAIAHTDDPEGLKTNNSDTKGSSDLPFKGIISMEDRETGKPHTIIAMDRGGTIYTIDAAANTFTASSKKMGTFSGALALWRDPADPGWDQVKQPKPTFLLAGYEGDANLSTTTGYTYGYREFDLIWSCGCCEKCEKHPCSCCEDCGNNTDEFLNITLGNFNQPGTHNQSTVGTDYERYLSTIGKYPLKGFFQTPRIMDDKMTLFASTLTQGLWSYRKRDGNNQWNAEE